MPEGGRRKRGREMREEEEVGLEKKVGINDYEMK